MFWRDKLVHCYNTSSSLHIYIYVFRHSEPSLFWNWKYFEIVFKLCMNRSIFFAPYFFLKGHFVSLLSTLHYSRKRKSNQYKKDWFHIFNSWRLIFGKIIWRKICYIFHWTVMLTYLPLNTTFLVWKQLLLPLSLPLDINSCLVLKILSSLKYSVLLCKDSLKIIL